MDFTSAYQTLYTAALVVLLLLTGAMIVRAVIGPRYTDRILSINVLGTLVICIIALLSRILKESYLTDVALIYASISFIAVLMLASMFIPAEARPPLLRRRRKAREPAADDDPEEKEEEHEHS